jgi:hypothetical protein
MIVLRLFRGDCMMNIYITEGKYYQRLRKGTGRFENMYLWRELKKILCFYLPTKHEFWLDDYGFEKVKYFTTKQYIQRILSITLITVCIWLLIVLIAYITRV